jgi:hypothetical protein
MPEPSELSLVVQPKCANIRRLRKNVAIVARLFPAAPYRGSLRSTVTVFSFQPTPIPGLFISELLHIGDQSDAFAIGTLVASH